MANKLNEVFDKTILINPASFDIFALETTRKDLLEKRILYFPIIGTSLYNYYTRESNIKTTLKSYFSNKEASEDIVDAYYESSHINNSRGRFLYACKKCSYLTCDVRLALSDVKNISIITGSEANPNIIDEYKEINSGINIYTIENTNLLPHLENVKETLETIEKIL